MIYLFKHQITNEIIEVSMPMKDYKPYMGENGDDENWKRIYTVPQVNIGDASIARMDPNDSIKFMDKTSKLRGTVGEIQDLSKELSEKRALRSDTGEDPIKRKHFDNFEKKTGKKHLHDKKNVVKKNGVTIDYSSNY
jgi:hypothetical protein